MQCKRACISPVYFGTVSDHRHSFPELIYTLKGGGMERIGDELTPFSAGDVRIVPPNIIHGRHAGKDGFQDLFLELGEDTLISNSGSSVFQDDAAHSLENLFLLTHRVVMEKGENWRFLADRLTEVICTMLQGRSAPSTDNAIADQVMNEIFLHYSDPEFHAGQALKSTRVCADYARRVFVRETGSTPTEVLNEKRLECAKALLLQKTTPLRSIGEIAAQSGFFDANYFSRVFYKHIGCSPSEWRAAQK